MKNNSTISQELLENVERFYNDTMSKQERLDFELRLDEDSEFRTQVEDIKTLIFGIENQSLKEQLDTFHEEIPKSNPGKSVFFNFSNIRKFAAVAVILIAITCVWVFSAPQTDRLYAKYFTPDPGLPTTMSSNSNFEFYDAMVNYKQGEYKTAIEKWEALNVKNDTVNYFLGVAYLANKNENTAVEFLEKATQNSEFALSNEAFYYLGLAYLKEGNVEKAKSSLQHSTIENSQALLSALNN